MGPDESIVVEVITFRVGHAALTIAGFFRTQPFHVTETFTGQDGKIVDLRDAVEECGDRIQINRLKAVPQASRCLECRARRERIRQV